MTYSSVHPPFMLGPSPSTDDSPEGPPDKRRWLREARHLANAVLSRSEVQVILTTMRPILGIPPGGFQDDGYRTWLEEARTDKGERLQLREDFRDISAIIRGPGGLLVETPKAVPDSSNPQLYRFAPSSLLNVLHWTVIRILQINQLDEDTWYWWAHDVALKGPNRADLPDTPHIALSAGVSHRTVDAILKERNAFRNDDPKKVEQLLEAMTKLHAEGMTPGKIGTQTKEGRRYLELKRPDLFSEVEKGFSPKVHTQIRDCIRNALTSYKKRRP